MLIATPTAYFSDKTSAATRPLTFGRMNPRCFSASEFELLRPAQRRCVVADGAQKYSSVEAGMEAICSVKVQTHSDEPYIFVGGATTEVWFFASDSHFGRGRSAIPQLAQLESWVAQISHNSFATNFESKPNLQQQTQTSEDEDHFGFDGCYLHRCFCNAHRASSSGQCCGGFAGRKECCATRSVVRRRFPRVSFLLRARCLRVIVQINLKLTL